MKTRTGKVIGRSHLLVGGNCQDAIATKSLTVGGAEHFVGVVCDGCSEGLHSEVGAGLGAEYIAKAMTGHLMNMPLEHIPAAVFTDTVAFLKTLCSMYHFSDPWEEVEFIKDNFLFTVIGVLATEQEGFVFSYGDGTIVLDDEMIFIDQQNQPNYLGYHLVDHKYLSTDRHGLPSYFDLYRIGPDTARVAVGSDAWQDEVDLIPEVWGISHPLGLQRKMNVWSKKHRRFSDDASLIVIERGEE